MAGAIPSEPGAADLLGQARQDATQSLRDADPALADHLGQAAITQGTPGAPSGALLAAGNLALPGPSDAAIDAATKQGTPDFDGPADEPVDKPVEETHGTGNASDWKNFTDFSRDLFKGSGKEAEYVAPRVAAKLGQLVVGGVAGIAAMIDYDVNQGRPDQPSRLADKVFKFGEDYVDPAVERWTPERQTQVGEGEGSGALASGIIGGGGEVAGYMLSGGAGVAAMLSEAFNDSAKDSVKAGHSAMEAAVDGAVDAVSTYIMTKIGSANPAMVKRIMSSMLKGDLIAITTNVFKKGLLIAEGHQEEADKIHWDTGLGASTVQNAVFGYFRDHPNEKPKKAADPTPAAVAAAGAHTPAAPSAEAVAAATAPPAGGIASPPSTEGAAPAGPAAAPVADKPSAEPLKDIRAQIKDMNDDTTARNGVFLSKANQENIALGKGQDHAAIQSSRRKAVKEGRIVTLPNGILIVKDKSMVKDARARLAKGEDPQKIIGDYTGAGTGKTADQTAVVQGQDKQGAVVTESAVTPAEVPAKTAEVQAAGNAPVVTTPEAATTRRAEEVAKENAPPVTTQEVKVVKPETAATAKTKANVAGPWKDEPINPKVEPLVTALNESDVGTSLSGDLYGKDLVYVDVDVPTEVLKSAKLPPGWIVGPTHAGHTLGEHGLGAKVSDDVIQTHGANHLKDPNVHPNSPLARGARGEMARISRKGGAVTPEEAAAVAKAIKEAKEAEPAKVVLSEPKPAATVVETKPVEAPKPAEAAIVKETPAPVDPDVAAAKKAGVSVEAYRKKIAADAAKAKAMEEAAKAPPPVLESVPAAGEKATGTLNSEEKTPAAKSEPATAAPAVESTTSSSKEGVAPASEAAAPKAAVKKTALESLPEALANHEVQETPDEGKNKVPLKERQDNASAFAQVLEDAAREAGETVPIETTVRAAKAAKAAKGLTLKSKNATDKGQGTGHVRVTALVAEMHKAARELLGKAKPGDEVSVDPVAAVSKTKLDKVKEKSVKPKSKHQTAAEQAEAEVRAQYPDVEHLNENALTRRLLKKRTAEIEAEGKKAVAAKESGKVEVAVADKYRGDVKPKKVAETTNQTMLRLNSKMVHAEEEDFPKVKAEVEQEMHQLLGDDFSKGDLDTAMAYMLGNRRDALAEKGKGKRMSETIEDEEPEFNEKDAYEQGMGKTYNPKTHEADTHDSRGTPWKIRNKWRDQWKNLSAKMHNAGIFRRLRASIDTGKHTSSHELLDNLIRLTPKGGVLQVVLSHLRKYSPDVPVFVVSEPRNLRTGKAYNKASGLFSGDSMVIQMASKYLEHTDDADAARTLIHEIFHAATVVALDDRNSPFFKAMKSVQQILIPRLEAKYGKAVITAHRMYLNDMGPKPEKYNHNLYGLMNVKEMVSEIMTNPTFAEEVADSEFHKLERPGEDAFEGLAYFKMTAPTESLYRRALGAIAKLFRLDTTPTLMMHFGDIIQSGMEMHVANTAHSDLHMGMPPSDANSLARALQPEARAALTRGPSSDAELMAELERRETLKGTDTERGLNAMIKEPPPIRGADEAVREMAEGDPVTHSVIRRTIATIKARTTEAVRKLTPGVKTEKQLFRDHMADFGGQHDPSNPARQLQEVDTNKNIIMERIVALGRDVSKRASALSSSENTAVGALLRDATMNKIDPRTGLADQSQSAQVKKGFAERHAQYQARLAKLSPEARQVFGDVIDVNRKVLDEQRRTNVDTALHIYGADLTARDRAMLYNVKSPHEFDSIIGEGMPIDIGEGNDKLRRTLSDMTNTSEIDGPYAHLGRHGDHVVSIEPDGTREFDTEAAAKKFADNVHDLTPNSKATVVERGGKWAVDYKKAQYTSMHENVEDAQADKERLEAAGFNVGSVTHKTLGKETTPLSGGMQELMSEAERKINRDGEDAGTETMVQSIRSAFLQITAQRSAFAGSRLARKNVAGVKATEMFRNFAEHITSVAWHTAQMRTVFDRASALAKVRAMARDARGDASQHTITRRGTFVREMALRSKQDLQDYGKGNVANSVLAKLGFANYLASPSHALVWMTQNFTTGIPLGGARWGYGRTTSAFTAAMKLLSSPAFRGMIHAHIEGGSTAPITDAIMKAIQGDKRFGKWAKGENSAIQQLIDRGVINHSYSDELRKLAEGGNAKVNKVLDYARILPNMADQFNRVSTALAGLELTGGDIRKAADFVDEVHADYGSANKPRYFKTIGRVPGMASVTMFKTYIQAMAHLLYGNIGKSFKGENKAEAAKTVAGLMVGNMLFCGLYGAVALEPLRLLAYGIQKTYDELTDQEGVVHDMKGDIHRWLVDHLGHTTGNLLANGPVPNALGFDMSNRMGLSDMFFHNAPDLLTTDTSVWKGFIFDQLGPMPQMIGQNIHDFIQHWQRGEAAQALLSIIPIKAFHDVVKAVELFNTGKLSGTGRATTAPSAYDSLVQAAGLRPSSVALQAERQGEVIEAAQARSKARKSIVADMVRAAQTGKGQKAAEIRRDSYNRRFPDRPITDRDTVSGLRFGLKDEQAESEVGY